MTHKNNHARSKQKRKKLRLKNLLTSIRERLLAKIRKAQKPRGITIVGIAKNHAIDLTGANYGLSKSFRDNDFNKTLNQRQKRKRARWANKKAA